MKKNKAIKKLVDAGFIKLASRPIWTVSEAITALYGYELKRNHAIDELINLACKREALQLQFSELLLETRSPTPAGIREIGEDAQSREERLLIARREILISYCKYSDIPETFRTPQKWVQRASYNGLTIAREWEAIFPYNVKRGSGFSLQQEPDYREFVDCLMCDLEVSLKDLVCYGLNVHLDQFEKTPACCELLAHIYSELWRESEINDLDELRNKKVAVSWFLNHCQAYKHLLDVKFFDWISWSTQHSDLVSHLSGNERATSVSSRAHKYDDVLQGVINELFVIIPHLTRGTLVDHFRDKGADAYEPGFEGLRLGVDGCVEIYIDDDTVFWLNAGHENSRTLRSLEPYIARAKQDRNSSSS